MMAGPWEKYGTGPSGPWAKYAQPDKPSAVGQVASDAWQGFAAPFKKLGHDVAEDYRINTAAIGQKPPPIWDVRPELGSLSRTGGILMDALGLTSAPVNAVTNPIAGAISRTGLPMYSGSSFSMQGGPHFVPSRQLSQPEVQQQINSDLNLALAAVKPSSTMAIAPPNPGMYPPKPTPAAALQTLQDAKNAAYAATKSADVLYSPQGLQGMVKDMTSQLMKARMNPALHPKATAMLGQLHDVASSGNPLDLTGLDQLRQVIRRDVGTSGETGESFMGKIMSDGINSFINGAGPSDIITGDPANAANLIAKARNANTRFVKMDALTEALENAGYRTASTGSGGNIDNATRQAVNKVRQQIGNWTDAEQAAIDQTINGGSVQNLMRLFGKMSPEGNGLMTILNTGGAAASHGGTTPLTLAAIAAKRMANSATQNNVEDLLNLIANGGAPAAPVAKAPFLGIQSSRAPVGAAATASALGQLTGSQSGGQSPPAPPPIPGVSQGLSYRNTQPDLSGLLQGVGQ